MERRQGRSAQPAWYLQVGIFLPSSAKSLTGISTSLHLTRFLIGDIEGAKADLQESIVLVPSYTQSLVKIASVHMEQGDPRKAFECFDEAIKHHPDDPDIYYHRGQGETSSYIKSIIFSSDQQ